jgi:hypothetical protein
MAGKPGMIRRPKDGYGEIRNPLSIRISPKYRLMMKQRAFALGKSQADYITSLIVADIELNPVPVDAPIPPAPPFVVAQDKEHYRHKAARLEAEKLEAERMAAFAAANAEEQRRKEEGDHDADITFTPVG